MKKQETIVECGVCGHWLYDHAGSTPCCGSIAYEVVDGVKTNNILLFGSVNNKPLEIVKLNMEKSDTNPK